MTIVDALAALVCGWFAIYWLVVALLFARTRRHSEAALALLAAGNALSIFHASLSITVPIDTWEGLAVRAPGLLSMALGLTMVEYLRRKAAGKLPVGGDG